MTLRREDRIRLIGPLALNASRHRLFCICLAAVSSHTFAVAPFLKQRRPASYASLKTSRRKIGSGPYSRTADGLLFPGIKLDVCTSNLTSRSEYDALQGHHCVVDSRLGLCGACVGAPFGASGL